LGIISYQFTHTLHNDFLEESKIKYPVKIIKIAFICLILISEISCGYEYDPLVIKGEVVDENGAPLSNVNVRAFYSGWGFSEGQLVWDNDYCSVTAQTNHEGDYVIYFKGPSSSRLRAWKEGWVQNQGYNTADSRIILTRNEYNNSRLGAESKRCLA